MTDLSQTTSAISHADIEKKAFKEGSRVSAGTMPGIFVWGLVAGMAMVQIGLTTVQALGMTFVVFAGSAQLAAMPLIAASAPVWVIFATAMVVNLRFVIFAAAVGPHFAHLPWYRRLWYGYLNADVTMAFFPQRFPAQTVYQKAGKSGFFTGIGYQNWIAWQAGSVAGIFLSGQIPANWGIGFAGTLALLAILIPLVVNAAALAGVVFASAVAIMANNLPYRLGLLAGVVAGMAAALAVDYWRETRSGGASA